MKDAWGRWGPDDETGAPNHIGHAEVCAAAALVQRGKVISLAQPISPQMLIPKHRPGMQHFMMRDGGDYAGGRPRPGGFQFAEDTVMMPVHSGTHLDALCHAWYDDELYNGFSGHTVRSNGAARCGIDKIPPIVTRGLLLDFVALTGAPLPDGFSIGAELLKEAIARSGTTPRKGDVVLLRTGWLERQDQAKGADFNAEPGLDVKAGTLLAEAGIAMLGADNYAIEVLPFPSGTIFPVHQRLIRDFGLPLLEGLVLRDLAQLKQSTFLFMAAPLPIKGGTGSPINPVAVL